MCLFTREEHAVINKYSQFRLKIELIVGIKPTKIHIIYVKHTGYKMIHKTMDKEILIQIKVKE